MRTVDVLPESIGDPPRRRYARDPRLVMAPLVAGFLTVRGVASLARTAVVQRREAGREHPLAGPRPDELGRPQA